MATVELIEQELAALEEVVREVAVELSSAYTSYLDVLGQAVLKHLTMASYHLCTQGYPEQFLRLSFNQRQKLQQDIQELGKQAIAELRAHILQSEQDKTEESEPDYSSLLDEIDLELDNLAPLPISPETDTNLPALSLSSEAPKSTPQAVAQWQHNLEAAIARTLKTYSRNTNGLLHEAGIIPQKLPEPLLEAAAKAEASAEATSGPPNLLNLLIENEQLENARATHIVAIHLRLPEIEFADIKVRAGRNQIRQLLSKLKSRGQEYHKKQREWTTAQAEAAWRSSWFEA